MPGEAWQRRLAAVRQVLGRRPVLRAGGDALSPLRRRSAAPREGLLRGSRGAARGARVDRSGPEGEEVRGRRRSLHQEVKICVVGGALRDELLGRQVKDRDWVVVGATPEEMVAKGFKPVGKDFPVFL